MKKIIILSLASFLLIISLIIINSDIIKADDYYSLNKTSADSFYCRAADFPKQDISSSEESDLIYMREEEKLAHDFYSLMYDKWGLRPFYNITGSEERHMAVLLSVINKYNLIDPIKDIKTGVFKNVDLGKTFSALLQQGNKSELDALTAAAEIEELDIKDLMSAIKTTDNEDLNFIYKNLINASGNHLRAFIRNIERRGGNYSPKHLDKKSFEEFLNNKCEK